MMGVFLFLGFLEDWLDINLIHQHFWIKFFNIYKVSRCKLVRGPFNALFIVRFLSANGEIVFLANARVCLFFLKCHWIVCGEDSKLLFNS